MTGPADGPAGGGAWLFRFPPPTRVPRPRRGGARPLPMGPLAGELGCSASARQSGSHAAAACGPGMRAAGTTLSHRSMGPNRRTATLGWGPRMPPPRPPSGEPAPRSLLSAKGFAYREVELVACTLEDKPGTLAEATRKLADAGINIEACLPAGGA